MKNIIILLTILLMFISCEDIIFDEDTGKIDKLNSGFELYRSGRYLEAAEFFNLAISDGTTARQDSAYMGLGYSKMKLDLTDQADQALDSALELNPDMTEALFAKMVISYAYKRDYENTIVFGSKIIELDEEYVFEYSPLSNIKDVYLHLALSEYQNKNYENSYEYMKNISNKTLDINSSQFTSDLISILSELSNELKDN